MDRPKTLKDIKPGRLSTKDWLEKNYPEFYNYLISGIGTTLPEKLYIYYNKIQSVPVCPICGKPVKFHGYTYGYSKFCSYKCAQSSKETQAKLKQSNINKYGIDYYKQRNKKCKQTKLERYGDPNYNNLNKYEQTCLERYGVKNPQQNKNIQEKTKQTCLERYGVEYVLQRPEYLETAHQCQLKNMFEHYGDVIGKNGDNLICKCTDSNCNLCNKKQYIIPYYTYYERKNIYNIDTCTIRTPLYSTINCNKNTSIEVFVKDILDEYNIKYETNVRNIISPKELDIYIPSKKIAIECNGCYWHSQKDNKYHYNKYKECKDEGIQLLTFWDDQIINNPNIIESILLSKLGIYKERIYARKCIIKEIDSKTSNKFLQLYHLQGNVNSSVRLGLFYNNKLVSIMTFGKKRKCMNKKGGWELYRYCNKMNTQIIGGASKLFKYFIEKYNPIEVESFSSNDISNGNLYKQLGFQYISTSISYWYVKNHIRYHRYNFRKNKLVEQGYDKNKTEFEIMDELGYNRIYDTGQNKWIYKNERKIEY